MRCDMRSPVGAEQAASALSHRQPTSPGGRGRQAPAPSSRSTPSPRTGSRLDASEFLRVGDDTDRLDLPLLHLNGQDGEDVTASTDDQSCLAVDLL